MITVAIAMILGAADPVLEAPQGVRATRPATAELELRLKKFTEALGTDVLIGDLVEIQPLGREALRISALRFGKPPAFGYTRTVSAREILQVLATHGEDPGRFEFRGSSTVVRAVHRSIKVDEVRGVAEAVLTAAFADNPGEEVEFELIDPRREFKVRPGRESLEFTARVREGTLRHGQAVVNITFLVDGEPASTYPLRFKIERFGYIVRTTRSIRQGEFIGHDNAEVARVNLAASLGNFANDLDQVVGKVARRNLNKGRSLTLHDTREPAVIAAGQLVEVHAIRGRVMVRLIAEAINDAAVGELVRLKARGSKKGFTAIAAGPGTAVIYTKRMR